jgi:S1-C subfamily serine protease
MKSRTLLLTVVLVAGFYYAISQPSSVLGGFLRPFSKTAGNWSGPITAHTAPAFTSDEENNIQVYKTARLATVNITSTVLRETWFFQVYPSQGTGSGFILNEDGEILTNNHVVTGSRELSVTLSDHKKYKAVIKGIDARNDLALIKITANRKLPYLHLGESDNLQVGQKVLAIGNPFGLEGTLTTGIVSSLERSLQGDNGNMLEGMIQTDAAINPGNSGGPLLDSHGNVIGINTAIFGSQTAGGEAGSIGIGFAMPVNRAKAMLDEFHKSGQISRPVLGVQVTPFLIQGELAEELHLPTEGGLLLQRVEQGSAADEAGLRGPTQRVIVGNYPLGIGGDLIVAIDGAPVTAADALQRALNRKRGGDTMELTIFRGGRTSKVKITLGSAPQRF